MRLFRPVLPALFCLCLATPGAAQLAPTSRAAGFAGAYIGLASGSEVVDWNPANLGLPGQPRWSVSLPDLALTGAVLGPPLGELPTLLSDDLTDAERQAFLAQVPQAGLGFRGDVQVPWIGVSVGRFAAGVSTTALVDVRAGREMVDLYLEARQYGGVDPARLDEYRVGDTGFGEALLTRAAVAYAHPLPFLPFPASAGITGRLTLVHDMKRGRIFEPVPDPAAEDIRITMLVLGARSGRGFGLDVGAAARPLPGLTVGLALEGLVQTMSWDDELELRGGEFTGRELSEMDPTDFADRFDPRPYDPVTAPPQAAGLATTFFSGASSPRILRLGAAFEADGTSVGLTASIATGEGKLFAGWPQYLALGGEQRVFGFWSLRGGVATSLSGATALALGTTFSMGSVQLTLAGTQASGNRDALGTAAGLDFPSRLAAASGYTLMLGVDIIRGPGQAAP